MTDLADAVVGSAEVGVARPDPRIFALALLRVTPGDALFVYAPAHVEAAVRSGSPAIITGCRGDLRGDRAILGSAAG